MPTDDGADLSAGTSRKIVVYLCEDGRLETHGGPYPPQKAREVREAMEMHIERGNYRGWGIPEDTLEVWSVTRAELRRLRGSDRAE